MNRRHFLSRTLAAVAGATALRAPDLAWAQAAKVEQVDKIVKVSKMPDEWRKVLTPTQFSVLREEGTERPFTSPLNNEKRKGTFVCAGCDLPLFESTTKYDSGTGWPSFYAAIPGRVESMVDHKLILPRDEYHCARCGGHQGHVFNDGPKPTGLRFCNNGVALKFIPA
ncbi:MAG: peptide-methionine (R)-S-oxide reductase MsrB [Betaproteobacteria bacterium]